MKILNYAFVLILLTQTFRCDAVDCASHRFDQEVFTTVNVTSNVLYGSNIDANGAATNLLMDIYEPAGDTMQQRPVIIWAHGGSFLSGTRTDVDVVALSNHFAKRGYVCVSISYRLGIAFPINQENATKAVYRSMQDMKAAIRFLRKDAATTNTFRIDPSLVFAGGTSAGAFSALHVAYLDTYAELSTHIDTTDMGDLEGNSGNPGYSSEVSAVIDLCGALGDKTWIHPGDVPFVAMHGTADATVPYATDMIYILGSFPVMIIDGSYSVSEYATAIGVNNEMYTYFGGSHVPFVSSAAYMDTTVRFVSNFLYKYLGCSPADPTPAPNTIFTGIGESIRDAGIKFFPNPVQGSCTFYLPEGSGDFQLSVYDMNGRETRRSLSVKSMMPVNMENLSNGIYFYTLRAAGKFYSGKMIVVGR